VSLQKIEKFNSQIVKLQEKQHKRAGPSCNESSMDSKKQTEASANDQKSECSKIVPFDNLEASDLEQRYSPFEFNTNKNEIQIFDQKSHYEFGDHKLSQLLAPEALSCVDLQNEMSYQGFKGSDSMFFDLNQVSYNSPHDVVTEVHQDEEVDNHKFSQDIPCAKKFQEDDIGLRIASSHRRTFAQKYLFKSEAKAHQDTEFMSEDDEYTFEQGCDFDEPVSHESSMLSNSFASPSLRSQEDSSKKTGQPIEEIEEDLNEYSSDVDNQSEHQEAHDMFFSCADWETQIQKAHPSGENFSDSDLEESVPFVNKRTSKIISKFGATPEPAVSVSEFDVDLVMKKASGHHQTEKIVSAKGYFKGKRCHQFKKHLNIELKQSSDKDTSSDVKSSAFHDLCLSPMGQHSRVQHLMLDNSKVSSN